jgi:hypothetical protein
MKTSFFLLSLFSSIPLISHSEQSNDQPPKQASHLTGSKSDGNNSPEIFKAKRCFLYAKQRLNSSPDKVFPLLCPTKEYDWIETWKCDLIFSDSGLAEPDCIFKTNFPSEGEETWITDRIEPNKIIQFIRVSEHQVIRFCISLTDNRNDTTTAKWEQTITALNKEGNLYVENCSIPEFEKKIKGLEMMINHYLNTGEMYRTKQSKSGTLNK